jgi:hypothetical protein
MGKLRRQTLSRTVVQFRPFVIERRQEDDLPAHLKGAAVYLETGEQEGYFVFDILANKYLAVEYEEVQGTWYFVQQDKRQDEWTAIDTVPTSYNIGRKFQPTTISAADVDDSDGSTHRHQINAPITVSTMDMSQTALSTAAAALTLAGTKAPGQVASFLGKGKKPAGQPPSGGGPPGGTGGGGGLPGGPPAWGGPFGPPGGGVPGGGGAPAGGGHGGGKLGGNPPDIFDGDRATVDTFMNQFNLYRIANLDAEQMVNPMKRAALFLGFIKGPNIKDWVKRWTNWTIDQYTMGRATNDEYYWTTIIHEFEDAFRDTGARECAEMRLTHLLMTPNEVDIFLAQFETMAHEAQYPVDAAPTLSLLASKLPFHMMNHIYKVNRPQTFVDWANAIRQYHQDNTAVQNLRAMHDEPRVRNPTKQKGYTPQQLAKILGVKMPTPDANTMDTRADRSRSWNKNRGTKGRVSTTSPSNLPKDTKKQRVEGRCFNCNKQGHISKNCPDKKDKPKAQKPRVQAHKIETENSGSDADLESEVDDPDSFIKRARAMKEDHKCEIMLMAIAADKKEEGSDQDF